MSKNYIELRDTQGVVCLSGEISSDDRKAILKFCEQFSRLDACLREIGDFSCQFTLSWSKDKPLSHETSKDIQTKDLATVLHCLRPFQIQKNNPDISFNRTVGRVQKCIKDGIKGNPETDENYKSVKEFFKNLKDEYNGQAFCKQSSIKIVNPSEDTSVIVNCEKILKTWLNAYEYHQDEEKQQLIEDIEKRLPSGALRSIFVYMICDKIKAIYHLAKFLSCANQS